MNKDDLNQLALETLKLSRNTLLVNLRFLDRALSSLTPIRLDGTSLMTDGRHILYDPRHVLKRYMLARETPTRDYLHVVLHCVFRHMYVNPTLNHKLWNLACDIAVENTITDLRLNALTTPVSRDQAGFLSQVKQKTKYMTAEKIYDYLQSRFPGGNAPGEIADFFRADAHDIWYMTPKQISKLIDNNDGDGDSDGNSNSDDDSDLDLTIGVDAATAQIWQDISERMQVDMETFGKNRGIDPGALTQNLLAVNREKYDYTAFLKKFAVRGEVMRINDDEFDYIFYTYGLKLYDKMPLIEPLEYKDVKRIREFVIAIDTSGSTSGELVQKFVQKTYNVLKSTESFFSKINLHIIQCDADIQEDRKITCQEEFDEYIKTMQIRGLGGTDFRPVFEYVNKLRAQKEFRDLKGLIYFTDGYGVFPARKPDYDAAFVFVDDDYNNPDVPPWAIKLILQRDEI